MLGSFFEATMSPNFQRQMRVFSFDGEALRTETVEHKDTYPVEDGFVEAGESRREAQVLELPCSAIETEDFFSGSDTEMFAG